MQDQAGSEFEREDGGRVKPGHRLAKLFRVLVLGGAVLAASAASLPRSDVGPAQSPDGGSDGGSGGGVPGW